jgi:hypothetical protein
MVSDAKNRLVAGSFSRTRYAFQRFDTSADGFVDAFEAGRVMAVATGMPDGVFPAETLRKLRESVTVKSGLVSVRRYI